MLFKNQLKGDLREMKRRIYGLETEYGIIDLSDDSLAEVSALDYFFRVIYEKIRSAAGYQNRFFYLNGAYIYLENTGKHPEYATPECASVKNLVRWDKAGERIFEEAMAEVNREMVATRQSDRQIRLYKNNTDASGLTTYGCHENYLVSRQIEETRLYQYLIPFLITRQILCGSGYIDELGFKISQRSDFIYQVQSQGSTDATTANRPIIHIKDEPLANKELWRRLHLILGDANMCQISTFLKVGTTALVLRMAEDGFSPESFPLKISEPVEALKKINANPFCLIKLKNSEDDCAEVTAIQIQRNYLNWNKEYLSGLTEIDPEWPEITEIWEATLDALEEKPEELFGRIDWVTKKRLMESILEKRGFDWDGLKKEISSPEGQNLLNTLKTIDLHYHDIRSDAGLYNLLEKEGLAETIISEKEIQVAKTEPPTDTRANWRASFLRLPEDERFHQNVRVQIMEWDSVNLFRPIPSSALSESCVFKRDDPLDAGLPDREEILKKLKIIKNSDEKD
jgi:proteasome accessory factor A